MALMWFYPIHRPILSQYAAASSKIPLRCTTLSGVPQTEFWSFTGRTAHAPLIYRCPAPLVGFLLGVHLALPDPQTDME